MNDEDAIRITQLFALLEKCNGYPGKYRGISGAASDELADIERHIFATREQDAKEKREAAQQAQLQAVDEPVEDDEDGA